MVRWYQNHSFGRAQLHRILVSLFHWKVIYQLSYSGLFSFFFSLSAIYKWFHNEKQHPFSSTMHLSYWMKEEHERYKRGDSGVLPLTSESSSHAYHTNNLSIHLPIYRKTMMTDKAFSAFLLMSLALVFFGSTTSAVPVGSTAEKRQFQGCPLPLNVEAAVVPGTSCQKFYRCRADHTALIFDCPPTLKFNRDLGRCDYTWDFTCDEE